MKKKNILYLLLITIIFTNINICKTEESAKGTLKKDNIEAIYQACEKGSLDEIKELLNSGVDINVKDKFGKTPLSFIIGGEPNKANRDKNEMPIAEDSNGYSKRGDFFLHENEFDRALEDFNVAIILNPKNDEAAFQQGLALAMKNQPQFKDFSRENKEKKITDAVELLLAKGADVNTKDNTGDTPLHYAAAYGYTNIGKELVAHMAKINIRNNLGETPLHTAVFWGHKEIIEFLLSYGADKTSKTKKGNTPLDYAVDVGFAGIVKLLGGDTDILNFVNNGSYSVIISNQSDIKSFLKSYGYVFNEIWIPQYEDIGGLVSVFANYLLENKIIITKTYIEREFVLEHFYKYNREYSGFVKRGRKYIICNMILHEKRKPDKKHFSRIYDGGSVQIRVIFDAQIKQVVQVDGNGQ